MAQAAAYIKEINHYAFPDNTDEEWEKWARRAFEVRADGKVVSRYDPNIALPLHNGRLKARSFWAKLAFLNDLTKNRPCLLFCGAISDLIEDERITRNAKLSAAYEVR